MVIVHIDKFPINDNDFVSQIINLPVFEMMMK